MSRSDSFPLRLTAAAYRRSHGVRPHGGHLERHRAVAQHHGVAWANAVDQVRFVESLARTSVGKINKKAIREEIAG